MSLIAARSVFTPRDSKLVVRDIVVQVQLFAKVQRAATVVAEEAKANVAVDTGELRDSIVAREVVDDGQRITGTVAATANHAAYVEFGTGQRGASSAGAGPFSYGTQPGMRAQPYLRPALDTARDQVLSEFKR